MAMSELLWCYDWLGLIKFNLDKISQILWGYT